MAPRKMRCEHRPQGRRWGSTEEDRPRSDRGASRQLGECLDHRGSTGDHRGSTRTAGSVKGSSAAHGHVDPQGHQGSAETIGVASGPPAAMNACEAEVADGGGR